MAVYKGWIAFFLFLVLVLVVTVLVLNVLVLLVPLLVIAAFLAWLISLFLRKRHKPLVRILVRK